MGGALVESTPAFRAPGQDIWGYAEANDQMQEM
jgi:hypothetical protein